ncbi:glycosyl hydrolase family 28 protein [Mariniphaga sediminis]|uniref:glycosyl hydrolase family 28 protein n=1 Tax=Mariniphaga sediminis TaxID=1628158 RepID=UPI0035629CE0
MGRHILKIILGLAVAINLFVWAGCSETSKNRGNSFTEEVTPNIFTGTDTERIYQAIEAARGKSNLVRIPRQNANGTSIWLLDSAILLPSNMTILLDNCTLQLSDKCRDNMFRSDNVGEGITDPVWNHNISIIGTGEVTLKGASNPRATGDYRRLLTLDTQKELEKGNWRVSYGTDAGKEGMKQKGDWRNNMIVMAYVKNFKLKNVNILNSHAWALAFERTWYADLSDIHFYNPEMIDVNGKKMLSANKDGIDILFGCKYFRINNITGMTGDDFIALSSLDVFPDVPKTNGDINSSTVTAGCWSGEVDDTEDIVIKNIDCESVYRGVAIRGSDSAGIHNVYIQDLIFKGLGQKHEAILLGGQGYGKKSVAGKIRNVYGMNVVANGKSLLAVESPVHDCHFSNGILTNSKGEGVVYNIEKEEVKNVTADNWGAAGSR